MEVKQFAVKKQNSVMRSTPNVRQFRKNVLRTARDESSNLDSVRRGTSLKKVDGLLDDEAIDTHAICFLMKFGIVGVFEVASFTMHVCRCSKNATFEGTQAFHLVCR